MVSTKLAIVTPLADMNMVSTITDDILAVDAGVLQVLNHPRLIGAIGDFDSMDQHDYSMVRSIPVPLVKLNVKKDITDLDAALAYGFDQGYQWVDVYGAIGKRIDHSYANILLLSHYGDHVRYKGKRVPAGGLGKVLQKRNGRHPSPYREQPNL